MIHDVDSKELQEMKEQLALLMRKLEKEIIVSERLIRKAMKEKAYWLRRNLIIESIVCLMMIPFFIWILPGISKVSTQFCIISVAFMLLAVFYSYYMYSRFHPKKFIEGNLIEVRKETLRFKKLTLRWTYCIGIPFLIVYIIFFIYEKMQFYQGELLKIVLICGAVGFFLGGIIGGLQLKRTLRTANEILKQIEELEEKEVNV